MKAYVLRNNELELMWAWEPESQSSDPASAASTPEIAGAALSNGSAGPAEASPSDSHENNVGAMQTALGALDGAVRTTMEPGASRPVELTRTPTPPSPDETMEEWVQGAFTAIGGAVRQQEEEIQDLREQVFRAEAESKMWQARIEMVLARLDTLDGQVEVLAKTDGGISEQERPDSVENTGEADSPRLGALEARSEGLSQRLDAVAKELEAANQSWLDRVQNTTEVDSGALRTLESRVEELSQRLEVAAASQRIADEQPEAAKLRGLESRVEELSHRLEVEAASQRVIKEPERVENTVELDSTKLRKRESHAKAPRERGDAATGESFKEPARHRSSFLKPLMYMALAAGVPLAGLWSYTQRGMIDHFREPAPPPAVKATIPEPPPIETPKVTEPAPPAETPQKVSVVVTAKEATWLEAEADNDKVFAKMLQKNQVKSFDASQKIKIRTGNQAGTNVTYNGKEIAPIGSSHHSGTFLFTPQDWKQIAK